jgi:predicted SAM-dependent methyltransferase
LSETISAAERARRAARRPARLLEDWRRHREDRKAVADYLASHETRRLQLGCGFNVIDGWLNTDNVRHVPGVVVLDVTRRLPFDDATFDYVFGEHMISMLSYDEGVRALQEARRILKPQGRIRMATSGLEEIASLCSPVKTDAQRRYIDWSVRSFLPHADAALAAFAVNHFLYAWGQKFIYDREALGHALRKSGFVDVAEHGVGESDDPELRGLERHGTIIGDEPNAYETFVLEARRP